MTDNMEKNLELIYVIVPHGLGSKVIKKAKSLGVKGATVFYGRGTSKHPVLKFLSLDDVRKEVILMGTDAATASHAMEAINKTFHLEKAHKGIAYSISFTQVFGSRFIQGAHHIKQRKEDKNMYQQIITIVDRGKAEKVVEAASKAGSNGGTIIHARGSGIHETQTLFHMQIEPEKEIVLILSKFDLTDKITDSIREALHIDEPNQGIIFVSNVNRVYGLVE